MKKAFKIILITITSLLVILIITISIALWVVFTPQKLSPIVRKQAEKLLTCSSEIGEVQLTFFSTFPRFGINVKHFVLTNQMTDAASDTLIIIDELLGIIDVEAWWKRDEIVITEMLLSNGSINIFTDSLGKVNYNIFPSDTTSIADTLSSDTSGYIEIRDVKLKNINLSYIDLLEKMNANVQNLNADLNGTLKSDQLSSKLVIRESVISFEYDGEKYLQNTSVIIDMESDVNLSKQLIQIKAASGSLNEIGINLKGLVENDATTQDIIFDLVFKVKTSPVVKILELVPPSYQSYFEGIEADGPLSMDGKIAGIYNDTAMPIVDLHLLLEKGTLKYADFPLPLHNVNGDIEISSDFMTDSLTSIQINRFDAQTPSSFISTKGKITQLFTNVDCELNTYVKLVMDEFNPLVPSNMKVNMKGKAHGQIKSSFSMLQIEKMQIEKMQLSGTLTLSDLDVSYDSLSLKTEFSKIEFALPNLNSTSNKTSFAYANISSKNLETEMLEQFNGKFQDAKIVIETSDIRDSTRIPDFICSFNIEALEGNMDTMSIAVEKPHGKVMLAPQIGKPMQPSIRLIFNSERMEAHMGKDSAKIKSISFDTDIVNDNKQEDIFLQWMVTGFVDMNEGNISMSGFSYPIEIPSIKMDFSPENLNIKESKMKIDKSDFHLSGSLNNVLSYFRKDSILRGNFSFVSNNTDVTQLMNLTSGIGYEEDKSESVANDTISSGPYMVPKGMDITLKTNIKQATFGLDTASNIRGKVRVYDGILLIEDVKLLTPAARMQLTAMYRTPRKNHLFLGLDYHMFDVEIEELLTMIPDIDTLMPMLRSFGGKGEFHIAVETYLDSLYNLKKSTIRGASSIKGQDLILMDGETFSEIAKTLKFNKKTINRVDSLSAEFTIFRDEIDIYPFLIVMDKYKAVVGGRHNFDLSFDYHISVVDSPLPIKLGVDVKGNMDDMSYKLAKCKYAELYRPVSRKIVENKQLELRKMIREAVIQKVQEDNSDEMEEE